MRNPARDLVDYLDGDSSVGLTKGTNLFSGTMRAVKEGIVPANAVFVRSAAGADPVRSMRQVEEVLTAVAFVYVRWNTQKGGDAKVRAIRNTIQGVTISNYIDTFAQDSEPTQLGQDEEGNHMFLLAIEMLYISVA